MSRRRFTRVALALFALLYAATFLAAVLQSQALQHDYDVNGAPGTHDPNLRL
jgi:hypothetical protein